MWNKKMEITEDNNPVKDAYEFIDDFKALYYGDKAVFKECQKTIAHLSNNNIRRGKPIMTQIEICLKAMKRLQKALLKVGSEHAEYDDSEQPIVSMQVRYKKCSVLDYNYNESENENKAIGLPPDRWLCEDTMPRIKGEASFDIDLFKVDKNLLEIRDNLVFCKDFLINRAKQSWMGKFAIEMARYGERMTMQDKIKNIGV